MDDNDDDVEVFILSCNRETIVAQHCIEQGSGCHNETDVADCVFLEKNLEDWDHNYDIAYRKCDKSHRLRYHFDCRND